MIFRLNNRLLNGKQSFQIGWLISKRCFLGIACLVAISFLLTAHVASPVHASEKSVPQKAVAAPAEFVNHVFKSKTGNHKYVVYLPVGYSAQKKREWPIVLFLHGAGERGTDGLKPSQVGLGAVLRQTKTPFPFIAVFPQCESRKTRYTAGWKAGTVDAKRALKILAVVEKNYRVNRNRRILSGWSMGGFGVWSLAAKMPEHWTAVVPLSGGGDSAIIKKMTAQQLNALPIWAFHGEHDRIVPLSESRKMVRAVQKAGGHARLTVVNRDGHDVWKTVYTSSTLIAWMQNPRLTVHEEVRISPRSVGPGHPPIKGANEIGSFIPAIEIPHAGYVRLGNDALKTIAYSVPTLVPREMLAGQIPDIFDSFIALKKTFEVQFSGIQYRGTVTRAAIRVVEKDRLRFELALKDITLTIHQTNVTGQKNSAVAGPMRVVIGHQKPVWLSIDVTPFVKNRKMKFKLLSHQFEIPSTNWYVTPPADVTTRGLLMTKKRVSRGLVDGIYERKKRIETEIRKLVPDLLRKLEDKLIFTETPQLVHGLWPLPVYRPRVRIWPSEIHSDKNGLTIFLGMTAAAIDPEQAPDVPKKIATKMGPLPTGSQLELGFAPNVMQPLMQQLIDAKMTSIHVKDIPEKKFGALADRQQLIEAIPDLKRFGEQIEIWSELILTRPLSIQPMTGKSQTNSHSASSNSASTSSTKNGSAKNDSVKNGITKSGVKSFQPLTFHAPELVIAISIRNPEKTTEWTPYANFRFSLSQQATIFLRQPNFATRTVNMNWNDSTTFQTAGEFAASYQPKNPKIDLGKIQTLFAAAWKSWTQRGSTAPAIIPDLNFGQSALRLEKLAWKSSYLSATLSVPGIKITNKTDQPLFYQTKGPHSDWSRSYRLEPHRSHQFNISYSMLFRSKMNNRTVIYTLHSGTDSTYHVPKNGGPPQLFQATDGDLRLVKKMKTTKPVHQHPEKKQHPDKKKTASQQKTKPQLFFHHKGTQ